MQADSHIHPDGAWFVRKGATVRGLFPFGAIVQDLLLGRLDQFSEISKDGQRWTPLAEHPELLPQAMRRERMESASDWTNERSRAVVRWADERSGRDRRAATSQRSSDARRNGPDRRRDPAQCARPKTSDGPSVQRRPRDTWVATAFGVAVLLVVLAIFAGRFVNPIPVQFHLPGVMHQSD